MDLRPWAGLDPAFAEVTDKAGATGISSHPKRWGSDVALLLPVEDVLSVGVG
jgi:hypothetical protein